MKKEKMFRITSARPHHKIVGKKHTKLFPSPNKKMQRKRHVSRGKQNTHSSIDGGIVKLHFMQKSRNSIKKMIEKS